MLRQVLAVAVTGAVLALSGCGEEEEPAVSTEATPAQEEPAVEATPAQEEPVTVDLAEQNDSGQSGQATLTSEGEQTSVVLELDNAPAVPQPVHIHEGTCEELNPTPQFPLENLSEGASETVVDVPLAELQEGEFAINAHASEDDVETYVACGAIEG